MGHAYILRYTCRVDANDYTISTLSGRTGGYPDDNLIKLKKKKKYIKFLPHWPAQHRPITLYCCYVLKL